MHSVFFNQGSKRRNRASIDSTEFTTPVPPQKRKRLTSQEVALRSLAPTPRVSSVKKYSLDQLLTTEPENASPSRPQRQKASMGQNEWVLPEDLTVKTDFTPNSRFASPSFTANAEDNESVADVQVKVEINALKEEITRLSVEKEQAIQIRNTTALELRALGFGDNEATMSLDDMMNNVRKVFTNLRKTFAEIAPGESIADLSNPSLAAHILDFCYREKQEILHRTAENEALTTDRDYLAHQDRRLLDMVQQLTAENEKLLAANNKKEHDAKLATSRATKTDAKLAKLQENHDTLLSEYEETTKVKEDLSSDLELLKSDVDTKKNRIDSLEGQLEKSNIELLEVQGTWFDKEKELNSGLSTLRKEVADLYETNTALSEEIHLARDENLNQADTIVDLQNTVRELHHTLCSMAADQSSVAERSWEKMKVADTLLEEKNILKAVDVAELDDEEGEQRLVKRIKHLPTPQSSQSLVARSIRNSEDAEAHHVSGMSSQAASEMGDDTAAADGQHVVQRVVRKSKRTVVVRKNM
ncbi:hypothetical protein BT63DRAFT_437996 [Microthyrium microscopicum]|uniref:Uncharacterized protein n=1 Tax=Microthyrium microscopicum TaxID=703497 RepID=A0A6A6UKS7_9PEZI|nr:hypothetical protein BT63DRAFT_437996 [Microthyrium microscopicum]